MKKIYDERGFLTKEGEQSSRIINFKHALNECLEAMSIQEIQLMGSILHKIVGDTVFEAAQFKRDETARFAAMTDEEFDHYLNDKYSKYGKDWFLRMSLTEEELERQSTSFKRKMEKTVERLKNNPPKVTRGWIPPRGRGKYID